MLDITDNIVDGEVVPPTRVVRYDDDDPYLVVAADKGTATFSDIANEVSAELRLLARRRVRLGRLARLRPQADGDHRARRVGVGQAPLPRARHRHPDDRLHGGRDRRHVRRRVRQRDAAARATPSCSPRSTTCTCSSIPTRIRRRATTERRRLFELPRSAWSDYDESLISEGGGVYSRTAKSIALSPQVREVARTSRTSELAPNELIRAILKAPVDLLYNGGIGTYVKASTESHADVGDKANDAVRVDARELRCRVVGEGGNLGLTQRARIEYALSGGPDGKGGRINTDAIDNVAGVNCSDHEVNIKILLDGLVARRRHDREAAQRAAGRDDRRGRRAGPVRQLHADAGDQPRARAGRRRWSTSTRG